MKKDCWRFINKSVRGASHIRKDVPCQDYSLCVSGEDGSLPVILAVSDGHGGSRYVRSAQGAVFACEAAVEVAGSYAALLSEADVNVIKQLAEARLKIDIIKKWRQAVLTHIENNPFSEEELSALSLTREQADMALASTDILENEKILAAYGATLLLAIFAENLIICEQLGDGDILFFYNDGNARVLDPVDKDEDLLGNETTSLCSAKAAFHMRHREIYLYDKANIPDLIMISTDGYANSFSSMEDYLKAPEDYYEFLKSEGAGFIEENIEGWLEETSRDGSGDDITIVIAWREE